MHAETDLLQVVDARCPAGGLAGRLHCGQEKSDKDRNDCNHNQKLDQGESASDAASGGISHFGFLYEHKKNELHSPITIAAGCRQGMKPA
jgi:hypothetical protein